MAGRGTDILLGGNPEFLAKREMKRLGYDDEQIEASTGFIKGDEQTEELKRLFKELVLKYKAETDAEKVKVVQAGGLCVIGTERHDSRRIDNQLRGRAGRQGDPGVSVFYISAEDDMARIFGGDMLKRLLSLSSNAEDEPIDMRLMTKAIESAQKRVESLHFSGRKNVLQYDDVNNQQRKAIYKERDRILDNDNVHEDILAMTDEYARLALADACDCEEDVSKWNLDKLNERLGNYFDLEQPILTEDNVKSARQVCEYLAEKCREYLNMRFNREEEGNIVPFASAERFVLLRTIDNLWMDHLDALDDLRQGVGLQAIGQHDPIMVYKKEAFNMFEKLNEQIKIQTIRMLTFAVIRQALKSNVRQNQDVNPDKKLNGPCPCGSGKKYKNCCYPKEQAKAQAEQSQEDKPAENRPLTKQEEYALKRAQRKADKVNKK